MWGWLVGGSQHITKPTWRPSHRLCPCPVQLPQRYAQLIWKTIQRILNAQPSQRINVKHPKIIEPQTAIVSPKKGHAVGIANGDAVVLATACFFIGEDLNLYPGVSVEG